MRPAPEVAAVQRLTHDRCPSVAAHLIAQRGITTPEQASNYFRPNLGQLHDPFLMKDMDKAVERIERALGEGERIMVYGDYDVDGTTAVALMYSFLLRFTGNIMFYIPDRYAEGYGVSTQGIDKAVEEGVHLIIALDCGIKSVDKVAYAAEKGIDFIICDHHRPGDGLPAAIAVLDPKRDDCPYPYKELSGCGIGFKLIQALAQHNDIAFVDLEPFLDLVAVSTACDIVPITGENRTLACFGLKRLNEEPRPGIKAMLDMANVKRRLNITDLVFVLGPRINAAGRIEHGRLAVELLLSHGIQQAAEIGNRVNENNVTRQGLDKQITTEALELIDSTDELREAWSTVLFHPEWHKGVIGIVASRLIETHYRPTIVLTESNGKATGSARSVKGFDVYEAINACSDLLDQFGGHTYAAGLTMPVENVQAFRERFERFARANMTDEMRVPEEEVDIEVTLADINDRLLKIVEHMAPYGPHNMRPVFLTRGVVDTGSARIVGEDHLKLSIAASEDPKARRFDAIAFKMGRWLEHIKRGDPFSILYTIESNEWQGRLSLQLNIKDIKAGVEGLLDGEPRPSASNVAMAS